MPSTNTNNEIEVLSYLHLGKECIVGVKVLDAVRCVTDCCGTRSVGRGERRHGQPLDSLAALEQERLRLLDVLLSGEATAAAAAAIARAVVPIQGRLEHFDAAIVPLFRLFVK